MANFLNNIASYLGAFSSLNQMNTSMDMALNGAASAAAAFRMAGTSSVATANYNIAIDQQQTSIFLDNLARNSGKVFSSQRAVMGYSGVNVGSKSFLAVQNDSLSTLTRNVIQAKNAATQRQQAIAYEGQIAKAGYENQAKQAQYAGEVSAYNTEVQRNRSIGSLVGNLLSGS